MRLQLQHVNPRSCAPAVFLLLFASMPALSQEPRVTVRVEVRTDASPVEGAEVLINGATLRTNENGVASGSTSLGEVKITVTKSGFLPTNTTITATEAREWVVTLDLRPQETVEENITVYATRTDMRLQDSPVRVEVLSRDEIEEKMLMTPGDIVMMLNEMGGLRVQSTSPSLGAASVRIQGL